MTKLTDYEKRRKIAKACGWRHDETLCLPGRMMPPGKVYAPEQDFVPDYCNCLNACHEMEKAMSYAQHCTYVDLLDIIVGGPAYKPGYRSTAAQRAEAFGLTLNLWQPGE